MDKNTIVVGVLLDDYKVSFIDICEIYNVPEQQLFEILDNGLIPKISNVSKQLEFDRKMLERITRALRLQADLGLNAAGVVLALELLDELDSLNQELYVLKKHIQQ